MIRIAAGIGMAVAGLLWGQAPKAPAASQQARVPRPPGGSQFVMVTPRALGEAVEPYFRYRLKDMPGTLVVLEEALASSGGVDDAERLKRYLYGAWRSQGIRYVLLVGDADVMPVRYMVLDRVTREAFDYAFYPSDLYYADVAKPDGRFENWNGQADGFHARYFGEVRGEKNKNDPINYDSIDYRPELAVGRWPVSTPEQVRTVADKSMAYEAAVGRHEAWVRRVGLIAVGGWVDARGALDEMAAKLPTSCTVEKRYYADQPRGEPRKKGKADEDAGASKASRTAPPDEANVVRLLNDGVGVMLHAGHGSDDSWAGCLSVGSLGKIHNAERPSILMSAGCSTARLAALPPYEAYMDVDGHEHKGTNSGEVFTSPPPSPAVYQRGKYNLTGLGEQLLRAGKDGAAAYIGCNTGSQPCGLTLMAGFAAGLSRSQDRRLGDCWVDAIVYYYEHERLEALRPNEDWYPPSIFFQGMKFMLLGDPMLRMGVSGVAE